MRVLILGGSGRIGSKVAADVLAHTEADVTIAGRSRVQGAAMAERLGDRCEFAAIDVEDADALQRAIAAAHVVVHCAGPFHFREALVLQQCIDAGAHYVDVSDHPSFTRKALAYQAKAAAAGITAIVNTGIFPGISNSMVRRDVEQLDEAETIHLSYVVAGSGGAGVTVMRTTFLGLQRPFEVWRDGQWKTVKPYSDREVVEFPKYGKVGVYWFDMPEAFTLPETFAVKNVVTKFATVPRFYNYLTWSVARGCPSRVLQWNPAIEFLSRVSHAMTDVTDRFSGVGVAIRSEVSGRKAGRSMRCCSTLVHPDTALSAGMGTGTVVELLLNGKLNQPGVWAIEQALSTPLFEQVMRDRGVEIDQQQLPD